jgi:hypothetical protein
MSNRLESVTAAICRLRKVHGMVFCGMVSRWRIMYVVFRVYDIDPRFGSKAQVLLDRPSTSMRLFKDKY